MVELIGTKDVNNEVETIAQLKSMPCVINFLSKTNTAGIQKEVSVAIAVSVGIWKNRSNAKIAFHITVKTRIGQLKNLSNVAVSSVIGHILNP